MTLTLGRFYSLWRCRLVVLPRAFAVCKMGSLECRSRAQYNLLSSYCYQLHCCLLQKLVSFPLVLLNLQDPDGADTTMPFLNSCMRVLSGSAVRIGTLCT